MVGRRSTRPGTTFRLTERTLLNRHTVFKGNTYDYLALCREIILYPSQCSPLAV